MEKDLAKLIFDTYIQTDTKEDFKKKIEEISKKYNKTVGYLKYLRDEYYNNYADEHEKEQYRLSKKKKGSFHRYIDIVEELLLLPIEKREEYLISKKWSKIQNFFTIYINNCTDKKKRDEVMDLYIWTKKYFSEMIKRQYDEKQKLFFQKACYYFDDLVKNGFYSFEQYINYKSSEKDSEKEQFKKDFKHIKDWLKKNAREVYENYIEQMENNRRKIFNLYKNNVHNFISMIDTVDIIDYYMIFKMPILEFRKLCKGLIDRENETKFNIFFSKYMEIDELQYTDEKVLNNEYYFNEKQVSIEEKQLVLRFMKDHSIPNVYCFNVLKKFKQGNIELDEKKAQI